MKTRRRLLGLLLCAGLAACGVHRRAGTGSAGPAGVVGSPATELPPSSASAELLQLEQLRAQALSEGDAFGLESILDADFRDLSADGQRRTKAQLLQRLRAQAQEARMKETLDADELEVRLFGDFAVVMGRTVVEGPRYRAERFTHVWRWQKDSWLLVSAHASPAK